jgi:hypothetical protein
MPSTSTDDYELELLERGPRNAIAVMIGGVAMLVGSVAILLLTEGGLIFYGAALASFGVMGKGWNDLRQARQALRLHAMDKADGQA